MYSTHKNARLSWKNYLYPITEINTQTILRAHISQEEKINNLRGKREGQSKHFTVKQVIHKEDFQTINKHENRLPSLLPIREV